MKLLLDTNVFIWASREPGLLTPTVRKLLTDPYNERYVSVVSLWEMQIKHALGKLDLPMNVDRIGQLWVRPLAAHVLGLELRHLGRLYELPAEHRDPFDRLLLAQALSDDMTILSADKAFNLYSIPTVW